MCVLTHLVLISMSNCLIHKDSSTVWSELVGCVDLEPNKQVCLCVSAVIVKMGDSEKAMLVEDDHEDMSSEEEEGGNDAVSKSTAAALLKVCNLWTPR